MRFSEIPYERPDIPAVVEEGRKLIEKAVHAASGEEQFAIHQKIWKKLYHVMTMYTIAQIRRDGDVTNAFYEEEKEYYDQKMPEVEALTDEYNKVLFKTPFRGLYGRKAGSSSISLYGA